MPLSAYIHIPFCTHKCDFCDFAAFAGLSHLEDEYCQVVCREIDERLCHQSSRERLASLFYGGGTPGLIALKNLESIHKKLLSYFSAADGAEISLETTPHAINADKARSWLELGINRLSIGVESLRDEELLAIGRDHSRAQAYAGIEAAVEAGFQNISIDFMYALPTQTVASWQETLTDFVKLAQDHAAIKHVSAYSLHLAGNSPLFSRFPKESPQYPDELTFTDMYALLTETLERAGFEQYEVSNFSRPGFRSRHNLAYWNSSEYLAFGVSAHRYVGTVRSSNWRSLSRYMSDYLGDETREEIDDETRMKEAIMLGLRLREGIDLLTFRHCFGQDLLQTRQRQVEKLKDGGFIDIVNNRLFLTQKGVPISNLVIAELM